MSRRFKPNGWIGGAFVAVLFGCADSEQGTVFDSVPSPGGDYVLKVTVIEPWFPQGAHRVRLDLVTRATGDTAKLVTTKLAYDGVPFTKHNIGVSWAGENTALACLRATDRPDQGIHITITPGEAPTVRQRTGC